ncbi:MAG TPA: hypothetical protein VNA15_12540 [Candidatus Angelobacter sp.]|nr:hypothetical protein [Candidatus Angelobacter sp.]
MSRSEGLEAKDPFLVDYKKNLQDVIKGVKKVGPSGLELLVQEMIRSRWIRDRRASYPYEVAWVFDRREESISGIMKKLEEEGNIEPAGLGRGKKGPTKPYKPRILRLPKQTIKKPPKSSK